MSFEVDGVLVEFINIDDATEIEAKNYIDFVNSQISGKIKSIKVTLCDDGLVDIDYQLESAKFERIRRITGYLTGSLDSWNNAKQDEERDRVKHGRIGDG